MITKLRKVATALSSTFYECEYDGRLYYCVEHSSGRCALFDHVQPILRGLVESIERRKRAVQIKSHDGTLYIPAGGGEPSSRLAAAIHAFGNGLSLESMRGVRIEHTVSVFLDEAGTIEDCRLYNLYDTAKPTPENRNRSIWLSDDERHIFIKQKSSGVVDELENYSGFYELLATPRLCSFSVGTGGHTLVQSTPYDWSVRLSQFAFAYHKGWITTENVCDELPNIGQWFDDIGMCIDHANSDKHNQCSWNLSRVPTGKNSQKKDFTARFKPPYYCFIAALDDGSYLVKFGKVEDGVANSDRKRHYHCKDIEHLNHFLKCAVKSQEGGYMERTYGTPVEVYELDHGADYMAGDFDTACRQSDLMILRYRSENNPYGEWSLEYTADRLRLWA